MPKAVYAVKGVARGRVPKVRAPKPHPSEKPLSTREQVDAEIGRYLALKRKREGY